MTHHKARLLAAVLTIASIASIASIAACGQATQNPSIVPVETPPSDSLNDALKVHMKSGDLYILSAWTVDTAARRLTGSGSRYDMLRVVTNTSEAAIHLDSVALFETNKPGAAWSLGLQGIAVMTTLGAYVSAVCLMDPKSCFGSCPTFYIEGDSPDRVQAEGFSASVARVLEARDVDALPVPGVRGARVAVHMKNEAWETHVVRSVNLLVAPRPADGRVFAAAVADDSLFYAATNLTLPSTCTAAEGDCLGRLARIDGIERVSLADSHDLATREYVELTFAPPTRAAKDRLGLVLTGRNGLITTFLFYQSMAYAGSNVGGMVASWERGGREFAESHFGMARELGAIDVEVLVGDRWRKAGSFGEHGPIASDTKLILLPILEAESRDPRAFSRKPRAESQVRVRLRMAKGHWRLDWAALAAIGDPVTMTRVPPASVQRAGVADPAALASLTGGERTLVSLPGDDFRIVYDLPAPAQSLELFLESRGYYYEWMRTEWLAEEDAVQAAMVVYAPALALRQLAAPYKSREARMEKLFWQSRFNRNERSNDALRP